MAQRRNILIAMKSHIVLQNSNTWHHQENVFKANSFHMTLRYTSNLPQTFQNRSRSPMLLMNSDSTALCCFLTLHVYLGSASHCEHRSFQLFSESSFLKTSDFLKMNSKIKSEE
jgi:hypothetical protein